MLSCDGGWVAYDADDSEFWYAGEGYIVCYLEALLFLCTCCCTLVVPEARLSKKLSLATLPIVVLCPILLTLMCRCPILWVRECLCVVIPVVTRVNEPVSLVTLLGNCA